MRTRREFLGLAGMGGLVAASQLVGCFSSRTHGRGRGGALAVPDDFTFLQLSDTHVGFEGPPNPEAAHTLERAVAIITSSGVRPDFIVFTGDLTHTTDDDGIRRARLARFKELVAPLSAHRLLYLPGEHDASLDGGEAFREAFGASHWSLDHGGVHFVAIDNVSDPHGAIGDDGLGWLRADLEHLDRDAPIVVFTHRPLFDLYPSWDWATKDGARALAILSAYRHVTVFYGHIHQEHHHETGAIAHHAATSLIFPLPAPGSVPVKQPVPWDPEHPFHGLGWRRVDEQAQHPAIVEVPLAQTRSRTAARTIDITAKKFSFEPAVIELRVGEPVELALRSLDGRHGFAVPELGISVTIEPKATVRVPITPRRAGTFMYHCDVFCGAGHEAMTGRLEVR